jgi:excisionase family DNA binding protein
MRSDSQPRTVAEAAAQLNLSKATIRAWIAQRRLGHVRLGRAVRIPAEEIDRMLTAGYVPPRRENRRSSLGD